MGRRAFAVHRWLGALVGAQLFLWSLGGLMFGLHDLDWVRGTRGQRKPGEPEAVPWERVKVTPAEAAQRSGLARVDGISLRAWRQYVVYEVVAQPDTTRLVDAESGEPRSPIDRATAEQIAVDDRTQPTRVRAAALVESDPPTEFRELGLPAWRVDLDDADNTHVWVDAQTGRVTARRNDAWRRFDFFWMLHTMDYKGRDDFNHPLLVAFAALGVLAVSSGGVLWALRLVRRWRKRCAAPATGPATADRPSGLES